jgi:glucokinase
MLRTMRIAVADIGGTKTLLTIYQARDGSFEEVRRERYDSAGHAGLDPILSQFLAGEPPIDALGVGIAGPVAGRHCQATNLPWGVDADALEASLGVPVALVNDFEALALGVGELSDDALIPIQEGRRDPEGVRAIVGAGTGLGMAVVLHDGRVLPSEGGHADFAPRNDREIALLKHLQAELGGRVSIERVVSGPGLAAIYRFLKGAEPPAGEDPSAWIHAASHAGGDPAAAEAVEMFVGIYGAVAANLALTTLPHGGLYVAGGIAPKMRDELVGPGFRDAFLDKGRFAGLLETLDVRIVNDPATPLLGARQAARARMARGRHRPGS